MIFLIFDVRLWVIWFDDFLIKIIFCDLIRVVIIKGCSIEKFLKYVFNEYWIG